MDIGKEILKYRAEHNLSMKRFAELANLTVQTVCNVENGTQKPSRLTMQKILNLIGKEN